MPTAASRQHACCDQLEHARHSFEAGLDLVLDPLYTPHAAQVQLLSQPHACPPWTLNCSNGRFPLRFRAREDTHRIHSLNKCGASASIWSDLESGHLLVPRSYSHFHLQSQLSSPMPENRNSPKGFLSYLDQWLQFATLLRLDRSTMPSCSTCQLIIICLVLTALMKLLSNRHSLSS